MIVGHLVRADTALVHLAYVDFSPPFSSGAGLQLPRPNVWKWKVLFKDPAGDGIYDDIEITASHLRPPHAGEFENHLSTHVYARVDSNDAGPIFTKTQHGRHYDWFVSIIRAVPNDKKVRRLSIFLQHTLLNRRPIPELPDDGDGTFVRPPLSGGGGVAGGTTGKLIKG